MTWAADRGFKAIVGCQMASLGAGGLVGGEKDSEEGWEKEDWGMFK